jgi:predicted DNA-binding helix-hairpin-helix protein
MVAVKRGVEIEEQVRVLMAEARDDRDATGERLEREERHEREDPSSPTERVPRSRAPRSALDPINIRDLIVPGVGNRRIFRILLTNACRYSCDYCPMRAERDLPRHALEPSRLARLFMTAFRRGWCDGLFVTSGIPRDPIFAMERMLQLVEILRLTHGYRGYLHAKALAGAEPGQIERLVRLVDRVSYNLEAPCQRALDEHAPGKSVASGLALLETARDAAFAVREARRASARQAPAPLPASLSTGRTSGRHGSTPEPGGMRAGATTQFVVGLGKESDRELLSFAEGLEKKRLIHHPQFAAFRPIRNTPLESVPGTPPLRERRLYQADHLLREYGFSAEELVYGKDGHLPLDHDPKLTWALANPGRFPVELTTASREELQRVPGFGPRTVERILETRARESLGNPADLKKLGVQVGRAGGFVTLRGRQIGTRSIQSQLFTSCSNGDIYDFSPGTFR